MLLELCPDEVFDHGELTFSEYVSTLPRLLTVLNDIIPVNLLQEVVSVDELGEEQ